MMNSLTGFLKRMREHYYLSHLLSGVAKPIQRVCSWSTQQIQAKVRRNGVATRLPNGKTMFVARDAGVRVSSALFWHGLAGHEPETAQTLCFFFERASGFLDVGANYGFYSVLAALWNPAIQVIAFEPLQPIYDGLVKNVTLNHLDGRIVCEKMALSSRSGTAALYLPPAEGKDLESTGTLAINSWQVRQHAQPFQIEAVRFDDYEAQHPMRLDVIKIDVEDFEADVLEGMAQVIRRDRPFIVCEILPRNREHKNERTRQIVEQLGYTAYWITPSAYIRVSRFDFERQYTNFLLSPVSAPEEVLTDITPLWDAQRRGMRASVA